MKIKSIINQNLKGKTLQMNTVIPYLEKDSLNQTQKVYNKKKKNTSTTTLKAIIYQKDMSKEMEKTSINCLCISNT